MDDDWGVPLFQDFLQMRKDQISAMSNEKWRFVRKTWQKFIKTCEVYHPKCEVLSDRISSLSKMWLVFNKSWAGMATVKTNDFPLRDGHQSEPLKNFNPGAAGVQSMEILHHGIYKL